MDKVAVALSLALAFSLSGQAWALEFPFHGFMEGAYGLRVVDNPRISRDVVLAEGRLQLEYSHRFKEKIELFIKADLVADGVGDSGIDLRELYADIPLGKKFEARLGRQIITWGLGDLLFINDVFPKDYVSFFLGRDLPYLKRPTDGVKFSFYSQPLNVDLVFTPFFTANNLPEGERLSFFDPFTGRLVGTNADFSTRKPATRLENSEVAIRVHRLVKSYELALYYFRGFFKNRVEILNPIKRRLGFPRLGVYGASLRGSIKGGIFSAEFGYYDSLQDGSGKDPRVENSSVKLLLAFEREWFKNFTGAVQYFYERMLDHPSFLKTLPEGAPRLGQERHMITVKLVQLLLKENLELALFSFFSPPDGDAHFRPAASYKITDRWKVTAGGNFFVGRKDFSFFGQLDDNDNIYLRLRYSF